MQIIKEHSGDRLASISKEELEQLLDLRVRNLHLRIQDYDCPTNRVPYITPIVEVLNALSRVDPKSSSATLWKDGWIAIHVTAYTHPLPSGLVEMPKQP